jgi:hypothetical protein
MDAGWVRTESLTHTYCNNAMLPMSRSGVQCDLLDVTPCTARCARYMTSIEQLKLCYNVAKQPVDKHDVSCPPAAPPVLRNKSCASRPAD